MKVVCINNQNLIEGNSPLLTVGSVYYVKEIVGTSESDGLYYIEDNTGSLNPYRISRFKMLRDINLDKLI